MKMKKISLPILIFVIGIIAALGAYMLTSAVKKPTVTKQDFAFSVTYTLGGETKTLEGVYQCEFTGCDEGTFPVERTYSGRFLGNDYDSHYGVYTLAEKGGVSLRLTVGLSASYLMGDGEVDDTNSEPFISVYDDEHAEEEEEVTYVEEFDAEIISWEYPEPVENSFVFGGFSVLNSGSMLAMLFVGAMVAVACILFVKKDETVTLQAFDYVCVVFHYLVGLAAIPFIALSAWLLQLTMNVSSTSYQILLCLPAFSAFGVAAAIALRRNGFTKTGFVIQLIGPATFATYVMVESFLSNFF